MENELKKSNDENDKLRKKWKATQDNPMHLEESSISLLEHIVNAEAMGESLQGQIGVAEVILNRVKSSKFPDTVHGVVYQDNQFQPVANGTINKAPTDQVKRAVLTAIKGTDVTHGALYFYNPSIVPYSWLRSKQTTVVIGHHVFKK